jgi:hypothetical protein
VLARGVAVIARGAAHGADQPVEGLVDPPLHQIEVGDTGLGLRVAGPLGGVLARLLRVVSLDPALQLDQGQPALGEEVVRLRLEDPAERARGRVEITALQRTLRLGLEGVGGRLLRPLAVALGGRLGSFGQEALLAQRVEQLVQHLAHLRLGGGAVEHRQHLARDHGRDERDALHAHPAELLRQAGVGVDVDLGEHPSARRVVRELLQDRAELPARLAPVGPEVDEHRDGARSVDDLGVERRIGHVDDG